MALRSHGWRASAVGVAVALAGSLGVLGVSSPTLAAGVSQHGMGDSATSSVRVIAGCKTTSYKPRRYVLTCADANALLVKARYQWWSRKTAHGSGVYSFNDCKPYCAAGKFHSQAASFTLYRAVKTAKHGRLFSRIEIDTRQGHHVFSLPTSSL